MPAPKLARARREQFSPTDHLSTEAIAAFADGELSDHAARRARAHIVQCEECRLEVHIQRSAAARLRTCAADESLRAPQTLLERLQRVGEQVAGADEGASTGGARGTVEAALRAVRRRG